MGSNPTPSADLHKRVSLAVTRALNPRRQPVAVTVRALPGDDGRRGAAAIHVQHASVDERGLVAGEVDRGVPDGLRVSETAGRVPFIMTSPGYSTPGAAVCTTPGEIALTRTPCGPNSAAQARVRVSTAPLVEL